jgi:hypothetical protein
VTPVHFIPAPDQGDAEVVVLGAELQPAVVAVVLVTTVFEELVAERFFEPENPKLKVEDDVGTEYRRSFGLGVSRISSEGGWSLSHGVHRMVLEFQPPVPPNASYLRITLGSRGSVALTV